MRVPPKELFTDPVNLFVAGFIGSPQMNLLAAELGPDGAVHGGLTVPVTPAQRAAATSDQITIGVRPEDWRIAADEGLQVVVAVVEELGSEAFLYCTVPGADVVTTQPIVARSEGLSTSQPGDRIGLARRGERAPACSNRVNRRPALVLRRPLRLVGGVVRRRLGCRIGLALGRARSFSAAGSAATSSCGSSGSSGSSGEKSHVVDVVDLVGLSSTARPAGRPWPSPARPSRPGRCWAAPHAGPYTRSRGAPIVNSSQPPAATISRIATHWFQRSPNRWWASSMRRLSTHSRPMP